MFDIFCPNCNRITKSHISFEAWRQGVFDFCRNCPKYLIHPEVFERLEVAIRKSRRP